MRLTLEGARRAPMLAVIAVAAALGTVAGGIALSGSRDKGEAGTATLAGAQSATRYDDGYGDRGDLFVLTQENRLYRYDKLGDDLGAGRRKLDVVVSGLAAGDRLVGLDTRPANGQLYAVGRTGRLYVVDPGTGTATQVGPVFATPPSGDRFGVDFNPTVDRLRIVSDAGQNLRVDPTTGAVAGVDTNLSYASGGPPSVTAAAYTNSVAGATSTALYGIDSDRDRLVLQGTRPGVPPVVSPNTGQLFPVGRLGIDVDGLDGFDIVGAAKSDTFREADYTALAAVRVKGKKDTRLVRVDLRSGRATTRGDLPSGVIGLTASAGAPVSVYATTAGNDLVRFDRRTLAIRSQRPVTGLASGEKVLGIDMRPANGQLYALGSTNQIYLLNPATAAATPVGTPFTPALSGAPIGFDVNPQADRLRVVTSSGQNLRLNPDTGAVAGVDTALAYQAGDRNARPRPRVAHAAYTNNQAGAASTTLYDIDTGVAALAVQQPPNDGTLRTAGRLGVEVAAGGGGFDIAADGKALAALSTGSTGTRLYSIDLTNGRASLAGRVGRVGRGGPLTGLAVAPRGA
jgi:Domain of unknown function (DUF4394)